MDIRLATAATTNCANSSDLLNLSYGYSSTNNNGNLLNQTITRGITPKDMLAGRQQEIHAERDRKLEEARNSVRFVGSRPREKGADMPIFGRSGLCCVCESYYSCRSAAMGSMREARRAGE